MNGEADRLYETQEEVEEQASKKLTARFKIARDAPISQGQLFDDIGYLGDTASTKAIISRVPINFLPTCVQKHVFSANWPTKSSLKSLRKI